MSKTGSYSLLFSFTPPPITRTVFCLPFILSRACYCSSFPCSFFCLAQAPTKPARALQLAVDHLIGFSFICWRWHLIYQCNPIIKVNNFCQTVKSVKYECVMWNQRMPALWCKPKLQKVHFQQRLAFEPLCVQNSCVWEKGIKVYIGNLHVFHCLEANFKK